MSNETKTITQTPAGLRNILQGLEMLRGRVHENIAAINSANNPDQAQDLREYFRQKDRELKQQIIEVNELLKD
jgi:hypothetical protein